MSLQGKGTHRPSSDGPSRPPKRTTQQDACLSSVKRPRLCGGSPVWGAGSPSHVDKREAEPKAKKESHLSKVSILKKKPVVGKVNVNVTGTGVSATPEKASMVETAEQEEGASGSGGYPIAREIGHGSISKAIESKFHEYMEAGAGMGKRFPSPHEDKPLTCKEMVDYEEDPDTVLAGEVSLSAATQPDGEDLPVIQSFSESQLGASMSSPMEGDRMGDEYMLFPGNVVDIPDCSDKEESEEAFAPSDMHVVIRSPTTSDDEFINSTSRQRGRKSSLAEQLFPGMDPAMREDLDSDSSNGSLGANEGKGTGDVIVSSGGVSKLQDEQISTKEDFEELIDERSRRGVQVPPKQVHARFFTGAFKPVGFNQQTQVLSSETKLQSPQRLSVVTVPTTSAAAATVGSSSGIGKHSGGGKLTSIILHNATIRQNLISVPSLVTSAPPAITIVNASTSQIGSMLPSHITVPLISASAIRQLPNIKVIDKAQSSLSLATQAAKGVTEGASTTSSSLLNVGEKQKIGEPTKVAYHRIQNSFVKLLDATQNHHKEAAVCSGPQISDGNLSKEPSPVQASKPVDPAPVYSKVIQKLQVCSGGDKELSLQTSSGGVGSGAQVVVRDSTPELKMTARVVHGKDPVMHITADDFNSADETKSVVISIPSPTPSQEQMLDNIALQALEGNRKDNNEFQSFEDMLDMIENITGETATILNEPKKVESKAEPKGSGEPPREPPPHHVVIPAEPRRTAEAKQQVADSQISVAVSSLSRSSVIPQLSPLSQPAELTTNMANVSQQLRSLLSSLHTTTTAASTSALSSSDSKVKNITHKLVATGSVYTGGPCLRVVDDSGNFLPVTGAGKSGMQQFLKVTHLQSSTQANTTLTNSVSSVISPSVNGAFSVASKGGRAQEVIRGIHSMQSKHESPVKVNFSTQCKTTQESPKGPTMVSGSSVADSVQRRIIGGAAAVAPDNPDATKTSLSLSSMLQSHAVPMSNSGEESGRHSVVIHPTGLAESHHQHQHHHPHHHRSLIDQTGAGGNGPQTTVPSTVPLIGPSVSYNLGKILTSSEETVINKVKYVRSNVIHSGGARDDKFCGVGINKLDEIKKEIDQQDCSKSDSLQVSSSGGAGAGSGGESIPGNREYLSAAPHGAPPITKDEESNVLLKQLLQNTACANTQTPPASITTITTSLRQEPTSGTLLLENQLNKSAAAATASSAAPPPITAILTQTPPATQPKAPPRFSVMSRETSFVSNPNPLPSQQPVCSSGIDSMMMDRSPVQELKKTAYSRTAGGTDGLLSSHPPVETAAAAVSAIVTESNLMLPTTTQIIKKEPQSVVELTERTTTGLISSGDVKKEFIQDESSQNSENSEVMSRLEFNIKEETDCSADAVSEKAAAFDKEELKKQKRRMYQQKRRQNLILNKELAGQPKKRARKSSKVEEDYDTYVDGVLAQMQAFPPMTVLEPQLQKNYSVVPVYGSGDLAKFAAAKNYSHRCGDLRGDYGQASIPDCSDYYDSKPYGELEPLTSKTSTTQREFYDLEFPPVKLESEEEKFFDLFAREDTPDSIVSSGCSDDEQPDDEAVRFLGLRLIEKPEEKSRHVYSPFVPVVAPLPVRHKTDDNLDKEIAGGVDKENLDVNLCPSSMQEKTSAGKAAGNVTVTLTLMSSAAEDILGVLRDLANVLQIPVPTDYQIIEQTSSAPVGSISGPLQKVPSIQTGTKDKDSLDIQSILNGAAKFCKHCDIIIGNKGVLKKASELPFRDKVSADQDELLFCGPTCYMQFSLMHKPPSLTDAKAIETLKLHSAMEASLHHGGDVQLKGFSHEAALYKGGYHEQQQQTTQQQQQQQQRRIIEGVQTGRMFRGSRYKTWTPTALLPSTKYRKPSDKEMIELLYRLGITVAPAKIPEDTRRCIFCHGIGDGVADGPARLLNFDVDKWVHLNCGLWSDGVYETVNGALMNLEAALQQSLATACIHCERPGATIRCFKTRCINVYHLSCAVKDGCVFYKNKTVFCIQHVPKGEKDNELTTLSVSRRVYVNRDENRQVAAVMHHSETGNILRVGSLILLNVGQLLPHQLQGFHSPHHIYPAGYKIVRFYWSMRHLNRRCRYVCSIGDAGGRPEFRVLVQEAPGEEAEFKGPTARNVWETVLEELARLRRDNCRVQFFPKFVCGEDLFGLTEPAVVRVLESLPGIETLTDYKFKYGRNPLLELPLAINPTGCARSEPRARGQVHWKRPHTQRTAGASVRPLFSATPQGGGPGAASLLGDAACPYSKQFVHSKSSQYKKMKQEWRNNVYLARSKIQGLGLYAARDLEKHTMVIEYIGEIIRTELAETREKQYEAKNRGIYMFRLDEERVVDATLSGGLARYINHSCNPNCVAEIVEVDRDLRIIIFAKRRIQRGEELAYDYKFDIEDDQHKISCMCGAPNCRKWMN